MENQREAAVEEMEKQAESSYTESQNGDTGGSNHQATNAGNNDTASTQQSHQKKRPRPSSKAKSEDGAPRAEQDGEGGTGALVPVVQQELKRPRGRPPGSKNKVLKSGPPLIPLVLHIQPGEDIVHRLKETAKLYKRSLVILAATGTLRVATLTQLQPNGPGIGVTVKGDFAMLSMSGSILQGSICDADGNTNGRHSKEYNPFLSVSLATAQGGVLGGSVAGPLEASSPSTIIVGHWDGERRQDGEEDKEKEKEKKASSSLAVLSTGS